MVFLSVMCYLLNICITSNESCKQQWNDTYIKNKKEGCYPKCNLTSLPTRRDTIKPFHSDRFKDWKNNYLPKKMLTGSLIWAYVLYLPANHHNEQLQQELFFILILHIVIVRVDNAATRWCHMIGWHAPMSSILYGQDRSLNVTNLANNRHTWQWAATI